MKVTLFPTLTSTCKDKEEKTTDWKGLKDLLQHQYDPKIMKKGQAPIFHPGTFRKGVKERSDENVVLLYLGVLDFDAATEGDLEALSGLMDRDKLRSLIYTTWSNAKSVEESGKLKFRLVIPFNRAVEPSEWSTVWGAMVARYGRLSGGSVCDSSCRNPGRIYYLPYLDGPVEDHKSDFVLVSEGNPLDVDDLKDEAAAVKATSPASEGSKAPLVNLTPESLQPLLKRLKKSTDPTHTQVCLWLPKLMKGAELGFKENEGHPSWLLLTKIIGEEFLKVPAEQLFEAFFQKSLARENQRVGADEQLRRAEVVRALAGAQSKQLEVLEEARQKAADENLQRCKDLGLAGPYTEEQLKNYAEDMGVDLPTLRRHLVFQVGSMYHIFLRGQYIDVPKEAAGGAIVQNLLPAEKILGLDLFKYDREGNRTMRPVAELVADYGKFSFKIQYSTHLQRYELDQPRQVLYAPLFPHPQHEPQRSMFVEGWFDAICDGLPPEMRKLLDQWVGWSVDLSQALALLLLTGPPDTGKSLFAQMLATYWDRPCASVEVAFNNFAGEDLCVSPIIFADEHFPADKTADMRSLISKAQHRLNRKYQQVATVMGHYRLIATANNNDMLLGMQDQALTQEDLSAVAKRVFHIHTSEKAAEYLRNAGWSRIEEMKTTFEFARHAEYLKQQNRFRMPARFGVDTKGDTQKSLAIKNPIASMILRWIVKYYTRGNQGSQLTPKEREANYRLIRVHNGKIAITYEALDMLALKQKSEMERLPPFSEAEKGFAMITKGRPCGPKQITGPDDLVRYRELRMDLLEAWLEEHDTYDADMLYEALKTNTPKPNTKESA